MELIQNTDLENARKNARKLSHEYWNIIFQVIRNDDDTYSVSKFYDEQAVCYYIKGKCRKHTVPS